MDISGIAVATITWARDQDEEALMRASLQKLASFKIPVFICDGGSPESFLDFLYGFSNFKVVPRQAPGLFWQIKSSIDAAYDSRARFILYTEPDKLEFFSNHLSDFLENAGPDENTGILLAERLPEAMHTFPAFQQLTETAINDCCSELTTIKLDYSYGPFLMNRNLAPLLTLVKEDIGWGWRLYVFGVASRTGMRVNGISGAYTCPVDQQADTPLQRIYRMKQLSQSINGIVISANVKLNSD